jgi:hypothetical protein
VRTTDHGQATGKLYHLWLRVESTLQKKIVYIYVQVVTKNGNEICLNEVDKDKNAKLNKKH